jgi:predicted signal transduction protein with EAL and GGDEF domain
MDLARDHAGERYIAVVVDLAREDQIGRITRVMGSARVDQLVHEAAQSLRAALGPERSAYQVGVAQFAFISAPDVEQGAYIEFLKSSFESLRASSSARSVSGHSSLAPYQSMTSFVEQRVPLRMQEARTDR